jgi:putative FmdB family regulatory protein
MPIYEYRCSTCGHELESLQKFSDAPLATCPSCHADALVKKVSAAGFQLKGSGWYATDFKQSGAKPATAKPDDAGAKEATSAADAAAKENSKGDSKGEPAVATKSETKTDTSSSPAAPAAKTGVTPAAT